MPAKLSASKLAAAVKKLSGWSIADGTLKRELKFKDFSHAFGFMTRIAIAAEKMDHHPDWSNAWNKVTINLVTHSAGGITQNDIDLAGKINEIAGM